MQRTTIMAPEDLLDRLKGLAGERGVSFAEVVREALEDKAQEFHPRPRSLGMFESRPDADELDLEDLGRVPPRSWR